MTVVKNPHHLDMDGHRIANLDDPTSDTEAATKGYVDRAIAAAIAAYVAANSRTAEQVATAAEAAVKRAVNVK